MPRANRHFLPGHVWHITHRCHKKEFLLKFAKDRKCWIRWLYEAKKRYGLCVLNYIVTSNHIHLLVLDTGKLSIPSSMQLIAGCTAQQYNQRKHRKGAFWEDRYHATAIQTDEHLIRCLVYIDLNMVRAGVVKHPSYWLTSGYREIQSPPLRKTTIDIDQLMNLCKFNSIEEFRCAHRHWIEFELQADQLKREELWTESVAVGNKCFVEHIQQQLGVLAKGRTCVAVGDSYQLKEDKEEYHFTPKNVLLRLEKGHLWDENSEVSMS